MRRLTLAGAMVLFLAVAYLLIVGLEQIGVWMRFNAPRQLSRADFITQHPEDGWYGITDAVEFLSDDTGPIGPSRLRIVPLRVFEKLDAPVNVFVIVKNPKSLATLAKLDAMPSDAARADFIRKNPSSIRVDGPFYGMVVPRTDPVDLYLPLAVKNFERGNPANIVDRGNVILLAENEYPRPDRGILFVIAAFVFGFAIYRWYAWSNALAYDDWRPPTPPESPPPVSPSPISADGEIPWWERPSTAGPPPRNSSTTGRKPD